MARGRSLLAGLWAGMLLAVMVIATPAPFATLSTADAGRVVARVLVTEATISLAVALVMFFIERRLSRNGGPAMSTELMLTLGALFCTVLGYFGLQPMMAAARSGQGAFSFGALHAASMGFFVVKLALVLLLAWRTTARP